MPTTLHVSVYCSNCEGVLYSLLDLLGLFLYIGYMSMKRLNSIWIWNIVRHVTLVMYIVYFSLISCDMHTHMLDLVK